MASRVAEAVSIWEAKGYLDRTVAPGIDVFAALWWRCKAQQVPMVVVTRYASRHSQAYWVVIDMLPPRALAPGRIEAIQQLAQQRRATPVLSHSLALLHHGIYRFAEHQQAIDFATAVARTLRQPQANEVA